MRRLIPGHDPVLAGSAQVRAFARAVALALARKEEAPLEVPEPPEVPEVWSAPTAPSAPRHVSASHLDTDELWRAYSADRTRLQRDRLLVRYTPLVRAVAIRMAGGLPYSVDLSDLVQSGVFGLIDAVERFDPRLGSRFESYAAPRIRGAMLDELRAQDWVPRSVRSRTREFERVQERLEGRMGRAVTARELAEEMGIPVRELHSTAQHVQLVSVEALGSGAGGVSELLVDDAIPDPVAVVQRQETSRQLSAAVGQLGERDRLVIRLYYLENRTLAEIGRLLGVTESRVCQLHSRLVVRLRGRLEEFATG